MSNRHAAATRNFHCDYVIRMTIAQRYQIHIYIYIHICVCLYTTQTIRFEKRKTVWIYQSQHEICPLRHLFLCTQTCTYCRLFARRLLFLGTLNKSFNDFLCETDTDYMSLVPVVGVKCTEVTVSSSSSISLFFPPVAIRNYHQCGSDSSYEMSASDKKKIIRKSPASWISPSRTHSVIRHRRFHDEICPWEYDNHRVNLWTHIKTKLRKKKTKS